MDTKGGLSVLLTAAVLLGPSLVNAVILAVMVCLGKSRGYAGKNPLWVVLPINAHVVLFCVYPIMLYDWLNKVVDGFSQPEHKKGHEVQEKPKEQTFEEKYPNIYHAARSLCGIYGLRNKQRGILDGSLFEIEGDALKYKGGHIEAHYQRITIGGRVEIFYSEHCGISYQTQRHFEVKCGSASITDDLRLRKIDAFLYGAMTEYRRLEARCYDMCERDATEIVDELPQRSLYAAS